MKLAAAVGQAFAIDGREAGAQAARQALKQIERGPSALVWVFASHDYDVQQVLNGAAPVLGDTPLVGMSTAQEVTEGGPAERSVVVALLAGEGLKAQASWWPDFSQQGREAVQKLAEAFGLWGQGQEGAVFLAVDGMCGNYHSLDDGLPAGDYTLCGGLAGGTHPGRTFQFGGSHAGAGGLAAAMLTGEVKTGVGCAHGWQPTGAFFKVTRADGPWVRTLDGQPASEVYARLFGYPARDWAFPPLNQMVRLYPLGVEQAGEKALLLRSPMRVEADGSLRMNIPVAEGSVCHLLVGSAAGCVEAARQAARDALSALGEARPVLALLLADVAWGQLLEAQPGEAMDALRQELGENVPVAGGYTLGQIARAPSTGKVEILNQHVQVVVFGEPATG